MAAVKQRIVFYLGLAVVCYAIALWRGEGGIAFAVFLATGIIAEGIFWLRLFRHVSSRGR